MIAELAIFDDPNALLRGPVAATGTDEDAERTLSGRRIVVAISGRSGKEIWNYVFDHKAHGASGADLRPWDHLCLPVQRLVRGGSRRLEVDRPRSGDGPASASVDGSGLRAVQPIRFVDVEGDGSADMLVLEPAAIWPLSSPKLAAFSTASGQRLWHKKLNSFYRPMPAVPVRDWPLVLDLDGDGCTEIVIPHVDALPPRGVGSYGGIRMLDGATGEPQWDCPLWPGVQLGAWDGLMHLLAAPIWMRMAPAI